MGSRDTIRLDAIAKLEFVREEATNGHTECSLLRTFRKHLPGFDAAAAKKGLKASRRAVGYRILNEVAPSRTMR